jgi:hypothetical protein
VTGSITVAPGGTLDAQGVAVTGAVRLNGALPSLLCGMTIGRTLTVERSPASIAPTVIGDTTRGCSAGDSIAGQTLLTGNRGPVDFSSNTTGTGTGTGTGTVTVTADSGTTAIDDDHIGRDLVIALNTRSVTVGGNRIAHDLVATQNASGLTLRGNLVTGAISVLSNVKTAVVTTDTAGTTMTVSDNTGAVKVVGNHAAGALTVQGNEPGGATVTDNSAGQDATCSDNHPMRGGGNSAGGVLSCPG